MTLLLKNIQLNGRTTDLFIDGNRISRIAPSIREESAEQIIDGAGLLAAPAFYNMHTHAAMSLLRGYADDRELMPWLNDKIWPAEAKLSGEDIYWGTKMGILEMLKCGTVLFNDMYFYPKDCAKAAEEMGVRGAIGMTVLEQSPAYAETMKRNDEFLAGRDAYSSRIIITVAPHAIYTVGAEGLRNAAAWADKENLKINIHLAETEFEVQCCQSEHKGLTPVEYLDAIGFLSPRVIAAHCVHLTEHDIALLKKNDVAVAINPCSNLKLLSGLVPFRKLLDAGVRVTLGTDGNASNNNLSMFEEMKFAAIVGKLSASTPLGSTAEEIYHCATAAGAQAMGLDAGVIAEGKLADILLLDSNNPALVPSYNLTSNLVYSADPSCVDTVICDGKVIMRNHKVPGEEEILQNANRIARKLAK